MGGCAARAARARKSATHRQSSAASPPIPTFPHKGGRGSFARFLSRTILVLLLGALALPVAACGRKGAPVLPPPQTDEFPHQYPKDTNPQTGVFSS